MSRAWSITYRTWIHLPCRRRSPSRGPTSGSRSASKHLLRARADACTPSWYFARHAWPRLADRSSRNVSTCGGSMPDLVVPAWAWGLLAGVMVLLISVDLFAHRGDRLDSRPRALVWSLVWIAAAVGFGAFVAAYFGAAVAEQYFAAYLLEKSLSVDNLFLFVVVF